MYPYGDRAPAWGEKGPVPSLRVKVIRDGIEDYDLLSLLDEALKEQEGNLPESLVKKIRSALSVPPPLVTSLAEYSGDPEVLDRERNEVMDLLEACAGK